MSHASSETHAGAEHFCRTVRSLGGLGAHQKVLVAGCGYGHEALFIRKELGTTVTGVDMEKLWDPVAEWGADIAGLELLVGSVQDLPFADNSFDLVFFHHVIEHVGSPSVSLRELSRVLRPGGLIYIGTPNRHRAVGYLGSFEASRVQKFRYNLADYKARVRGRFRNEFGAHAGFSERELSTLLEKDFTNVRFLTADYLRFKYGARVPRPVLELACARPFREVAAPSVYAIARRA